MEQRQASGPDLRRQPHGVLDGAVTPRALRGELGRRVLGVVDQEVDAAAELLHAFVDPQRGARLLVVADVGHAGAAVAHPVPVGLADMGHGARLHLVATDPEALGGVADLDPAREVVQPDREQGRADRLREHIV